MCFATMSSTIGQKVLHSQAREIVFNVYNYLKTENENCSIIDIKGMVSSATGVSIRTIGRIIKEGNTPPENESDPLFKSPGKKRQRVFSVTGLQDYECYHYRNIIYNFHKSENCRVTLAALQQTLRNTLDWQGQASSLRVVLNKLGFKWRRAHNNRKLLIEKSDIRALRIAYLNKIKKFRQEQRPIVFLDETYIHGGHTISKSWSDDTTNGLFTNISKGDRLIIIHAGGSMGFIPGCLQIFKSGSTSGDYHDEMNSVNYEKWITEKLIPNLPPNSVVVTDNAPYHNVQINRAPNSNSKKADMVSWLTEKHFTFTPQMLKPQLYDIIKRHKKQFIQYKFDKIFNENGHSVVRLPPYHPDLNPIELIWATVKNRVAKLNTTFKLNDVWKLAESEFSSITPEDWIKRCEHVIQVEDNYLENEIIIDCRTEELIINLNDDDSDSDFGFESESD